MIKQISWGDYWLVIGIAATIYYSFLLLLYYRKEILDTVTSKAGKLNEGRRADILPERTLVTNTAVAAQAEPGTDDLLSEAQETAEKIKDFMQGATAKGQIKEEFIMGLQLILKEHVRLKDTHYGKSLNDLISFEFENTDSIHLSAEEINVLWMG